MDGEKRRGEDRLAADLLGGLQNSHNAVWREVSGEHRQGRFHVVIN